VRSALLFDSQITVINYNVG